MNKYFNIQAEVVVNGLMKFRGLSRDKALELWTKSKTRQLIQEEYKMEHISGARCYDELLMEIENDPYWMKGQFD
ncbi:MAG: hypothetical protein HDR05_12455 [Lachnospiraceae bacterium]|nr:hypothetical protein [Lachnospiraceae bacterium]